MKALGVCAACLVWLCGVAAASAADLKDPVPGHPGLSYFTLVRSVVTDLAADGSGHRVAPFQFIDSVSTRGTTMCSYQRDRDPTFSTIADPGPYRAIQVVVRRKVTRSGEDCGDEKPPKAGVSSYQAVYRWDARTGRFTTTSTAPKRLAAHDDDD